MLRENLAIAFQQLKSGKLRSMLTLLGITIGIATVISIVSVLEGYFANITRDLNVLGANTFQIEKNERIAGINMGPDKKKYRPNIKKELAAEIREKCRLVALVGAEEWQGGQRIIYRDKHTNPNIQVAGGEPEFFPNNGYFIGRGRAITRQDNINNRRVVVLGMDAVDVLFPFEEPIGKTVKIAGTRFKVIGLIEEMGSQSFGGSKDNIVVIPLTTFEDVYGRERSANITVSVREGVDYQQAVDEVIGVTRRFRKVGPGEENNFSIFSNDMLVSTFDQIAGSIQLAATLLGMISLIVGSIGVMNIMLVTVTERTREIGIRKAVGARRAAILMQFLQESVILSLIGGLLGIVLGFLLAGFAAAQLDIPFVAPVWAIVGAILTTAAVGILAGLYPAYKAARMSPINALRFE